MESLAFEVPVAAAALPCCAPMNGCAEGGGLLMEELLPEDELLSLEELVDGGGRPVKRSTDG